LANRDYVGDAKCSLSTNLPLWTDDSNSEQKFVLRVPVFSSECESFDTLSRVAYVGDAQYESFALSKICALKKRFVLIVPVFCFKCESSALS